MSNLSGQKSMRFLHHNQIFDVTIEKRDYDIKSFIVMQKGVRFGPSPWAFDPLKLNLWTGYVFII